MAKIKAAVIFGGTAQEHELSLASAAEVISNIPKDILEVAELEGAGGLYKFIHIKLRYLSPTILFVFILSMINSFKIFREEYLLTGNYPHNKRITVCLTEAGSESALIQKKARNPSDRLNPYFPVQMPCIHSEALKLYTGLMTSMISMLSDTLSMIASAFLYAAGASSRVDSLTVVE